MAQSRLTSFTEALTNVVAGLALALATQMALYPAFGIRIGFWENLKIALSFTGLSLAFGDTSGGFRRLIQIIFGLSIAFSATSFFLAFFSFGGGALI